jgi:octaprenyl-diphosphate synthase
MKIAKDDSNINPLLNLKNLVRDDLEKVDNLIYSLIASKIALIPQISRHTISSGGKRLRPILTLASAKICGYQGSAHIELAACVEFMHTATLLHDDVVDKSDLRRGESTANNLWGNKESILVGDYLLGKSFDLMGAANSIDIYKTLSNAAVIISEGEVMQLVATGNIDSDIDSYIKIISAKTAELFAASCQIGAILANKNDSEIYALRLYGLNLGIAFQLIDDLLDYFSTDKLLGKKIGDDFFEKKITLPIIIAYNQATEDERILLRKMMRNSTAEYKDFTQVLNIMNNYDIRQKVLKFAQTYVVEAKNKLDIFANSELKTAFIDILDFTVNREF